MIFLIICVVTIVSALVWAIIGESLLYMVYKPSEIKPILNQYAGNRTMQILRALSDGQIKPSGIRHYFNYGVSGQLSWSREEFVLLRQIADRNECEIITKHSGGNESCLDKITLDIKHGRAVITKEWRAV